MNDTLKWIGKVLLQGILWVFVLSIKWNGHTTLFTAANDVFVQNALVDTVDQELGELWYKAKEAAKLTFNSAREGDDKSL